MPLLRYFSLGLCGLAAPLLSALANSQGSPICEVNGLPLREMSPVVASPAPTGWRVSVPAEVYFPGEPLPVAVVNDDPAREARGVLLWAKRSALAGAGVFPLPPGGRFQYVPPSPIARCDEWAITHTDAVPKGQDQLLFTWRPPADGAVIFRAFVIEDCEAPAGCRAAQALTPVLPLAAGVFRSGFEG